MMSSDRVCKQKLLYRLRNILYYTLSNELEYVCFRQFNQTREPQCTLLNILNQQQAVLFDFIPAKYYSQLEKCRPYTAA